MNTLLRRMLPFCSVSVFVGLLVWWMQTAPPTFLERTPEASAHPVMGDRGPDRFWEAGRLHRGMGDAVSLPGRWSQFRGADGTNIVSDRAVKIFEKWGQKEPRELWSIDVGEGHAGAAIQDGRVYLLDYDRESRSDVLRCLSLQDGEEIWSYSYPNRIKRNFGITRTVPAVTDNSVVTIGPKGQVLSLNPLTGAFQWAFNMPDKWGTEIPKWYMGQCPRIVDGKVILAPGGKVLMAAVDEKDGKVLWETPNPRNWKITHSSLTIMELDGVKQAVYPSSDGVVSVSVRSGKVLWEHSGWKVRVSNIPAPVALPDGRIFFTGGYDSGSMMAKVTRDDKWAVKELYRLEADVLGSHIHTPIWYRNLLFGISEDHELVCLTAEGDEKWRSDKKHRLGLGPFMVVNDYIFALSEDGVLSLVRVDGSRFDVLTEAQVLTGDDAWAPMAFAGGLLIVRDTKVMKCLEVGTVDGSK
jgi:outer membrane protein assembly factor BamB